MTEGGRTRLKTIQQLIKIIMVKLGSFKNRWHSPHLPQRSYHAHSPMIIDTQKTMGIKVLLFFTPPRATNHEPRMSLTPAQSQTTPAQSQTRASSTQTLIPMQFCI